MNIHIALHHWPHPFPAQRLSDIRGHSISILEFAQQSLQDPFQVEFDSTLSELANQFSAYTEGDGSFGFSIPKSNGEIIKIAGTVVEQDNWVDCLDMWLDGCDCETFNAILKILNCPPERCVVQLLDFGSTVAATELARFLGDIAGLPDEV